MDKYVPEEDQIVTIAKKHYEALLEAEQFLECLYAAGVDSWEGFSSALDDFNVEYEDDADA